MRLVPVSQSINQPNVSSQKQFSQRGLTFLNDTLYPSTLEMGEVMLKQKEKNHPPICPAVHLEGTKK